jgi:hypothetical protein
VKKTMTAIATLLERNRATESCCCALICNCDVTYARPSHRNRLPHARNATHNNEMSARGAFVSHEKLELIQWWNALDELTWVFPCGDSAIPDPTCIARGLEMARE